MYKVCFEHLGCDIMKRIQELILGHYTSDQDLCIIWFSFFRGGIFHNIS